MCTRNYRGKYAEPRWRRLTSTKEDETGQPSVATTHRDDVPLASARSGQRERVFMITGIGVHDRTD